MEDNKSFLEKFVSIDWKIYFVNKKYIDHVFDYENHTSLTDEYFSVILWEYQNDKMTIRQYIEWWFWEDKFSWKEAVEMYFDIKSE